MDQQTGTTTSKPRRRRPRRRRSRSKQASQEETEPRTPVDNAARRFDIQQLRPEQTQVIDAVLEGRDVLMVLPTGYGKSACYQVPSLLLQQPVVMISPLKALLKDQEAKLIERDLPVVRLDGAVRGKKRLAALERIETGGPMLVMTTPETLATTDTSEALRKARVSLIAIDEAHCLSEWGHDFRPAYLRLGSRMEALGSPPMLALTATATHRVREGIIKSLRMRDPKVVASSPHRSNLAFEVLPCEEGVRARVMLRLVKRLRRPGIVYCATRREVDMVYAWLRRFGIPAHRYHAGMPAAERNAEQEHFMRGGHRTVMVATNAFGLGIDKPDIRYILHYQSPASLEQYVQEAGRGGRDGAKANCIVLPDAADRRIHEALLSRSRLRPDQLYRMGSALAAWSDEDKSPGLEALALSAEVGPRVAMALVAKIEEAGLIYFENDEIRFTDPSIDLEEATRALAGQFETLRTQDGRRLDALGHYFGSEQCRAQFLSNYFGEDMGEVCGLCDICRGSPARPASFFAAHTAPDRPKRKTRSSRRGKRSGGRRKKSTSKKVRAAKAPINKSEVAQGAGSEAPGERPARKGRARRRRRRPRRRPEATPEATPEA
ncbi:MAG: RecQ family ATP-dependent DNA helicase [Myxococcota bacterium]